MPLTPLVCAARFEDCAGATFGIPGCVGTAFLLSGNWHQGFITVTEIYSHRQWVERWGDLESGLRAMIARGELVELIGERG